jgi:serine/threonine protein phosphatase PrpC
MLVQTDGESLTPRDLTTDHKPTIRSETKRILLTGGELRAIRYPEGDEGPVRVWCSGQDVPGLAMSRSVCDTVGKRAGVISEAEITTATLQTTDAFLVVASDGLFEFMAGEDVCTGVLIAHKQAMEAGTPDEHLTVAVNELRRESTERWIEQEAGNVDDCSIIIAEIGHVVAAP